jgi:hypothetical protein
MQADASPYRGRLGLQLTAAALKHVLRRIESNDVDTGPRRGNEHAPGSAAEFEHRPSALRAMPT